MKISELHPYTDSSARAGRYRQDGCLFVRGALDPAALAAVSGQAAAALRSSGLAEDQGDTLTWTGRPVPHLDDTGINDIPALDDLVDRIDRGTDPIRPAADRIFGRPTLIWRGLHIFASIPDDPAYVTAPHQDNFAYSPDGDYRRLWIALTEIPYGDGGLGLAAGSHRSGRLPHTTLADFADRPAPGSSAGSRRPATGVDPHLVDDHWHTAPMSPGDLLTFSPHTVHRGLPGTSGRIRLALAVIASGATDPRPDHMYTGPEHRARHNRVRQIAAPLNLSEIELFKISADLNRAGAEINEQTVRAAAEARETTS